jgi:tetratricopeptide (TPR) repeat protein
MLETMRFVVALLACAAAAAAQAAAPEQLFRDAVAAQQRGDDSTAVRKYQELLKLRPDVVEVRANLGAALARQGRFDEAIEQYRAALAKDAASAPLRMNLALAYYKKSAYADAARELETVRRAASSDARIATLLADCYVHLARHAEAVALLQPLEAAHPGDLGVAWILGSALIGAGKLRDGLENVEKVARGGSSAEAHLLAGQTALKLNEFERARDHADAALRLNPRLLGVQTLRGMVLPYLGDNHGAIAALNAALAADSNDFDAHLNLGAILQTERDLEAARPHLERALALRPAAAMARYEIARLERAEGKLDDAIRDFEKVIHDEPAWAQPHLELSTLYYRVNRPADGDRERAAYEKLNAAPEKRQLP